MTGKNFTCNQYFTPKKIFTGNIQVTEKYTDL